MLSVRENEPGVGTSISGIRLTGMPLEELLFGFSFGTYWSGLYEHLNWQAPQPFKAARRRGHEDAA